MARLTRHELKEHKIQTAFEEYEQFAKKHYREIALVAGLALVIVGLVVGLRILMERQEASANAQLGEALDTFTGYVGTASPGMLSPGTQTFPTAKEKYTKALTQFSAITDVKGIQRMLPQQKAVGIARYHVGLCQAELGDDATAIKTLTQASDDRDPEIASLARLALAQELAKTGKVADGVKLLMNLEDHPTSSVPKATAKLARAEALRTTQPGQARLIYQQMGKEYASDAVMAESLKEELASLPK